MQGGHLIGPLRMMLFQVIFLATAMRLISRTRIHAVFKLQGYRKVVNYLLSMKHIRLSTLHMFSSRGKLGSSMEQKKVTTTSRKFINQYTELRCKILFNAHILRIDGVTAEKATSTLRNEY